MLPRHSITRMLAPAVILVGLAVVTADAKVLVVAHRGCRLTHPENTLVCFQHALDIGVDWIETDSWLSSDGVPMLHHDIDLCRTTDIEAFPGFDCTVEANNPLGRFPRVGDLTLQQLKLLDVGSWFDPAFAGTPMPTLEEALLLLEDSGVPLLVEIKDLGQAPIVRQILEANTIAPANIIIWNRNHSQVEFKEELPAVRRIRGYHTSETTTAQQLAALAADGAFGLAATSPGFTQPFVEAVRANGLFLYSVPEATGAMDFYQQIDLGVEGLHSQAPETLLTLLSFLHCVDGLDNDGDGLIDFEGYDVDLDHVPEFPPDPECIGRLDDREVPQCMDWVDNDHDGYKDYPADLGCDSALDIVESGPDAGAVPDGSAVPGPPLLLQRLPGGDLQLTYGASCMGGDTDFGVYEGTLGSFGSHGILTCSTAGATSAIVPAGSGDRYYLVVPSNGNVEGSYGTDSTGAERPQGTACAVQSIGDCR